MGKSAQFVQCVQAIDRDLGIMVQTHKVLQSWQGYGHWRTSGKANTACLFLGGKTWDVTYFLKWAIPSLVYHLFLVFSNKHYNFYNNI